MTHAMLFPKHTKRLTVIVPVEHNDTIEDVAMAIRDMAIDAQHCDGYAPRRQIEIVRSIVKDALSWRQPSPEQRTSPLPSWQRKVLVTASDYVLHELSSMVLVGEHAKRGTPLPSAVSLGYDAQHSLTIDDIDVYTVDPGGVFAAVPLGPMGFRVDPVEDLISALCVASQRLYEEAGEVSAPASAEDVLERAQSDKVTT